MPSYTAMMSLSSIMTTPLWLLISVSLFYRVQHPFAVDGDQLVAVLPKDPKIFREEVPVGPAIPHDHQPHVKTELRGELILYRKTPDLWAQV